MEQTKKLSLEELKEKAGKAFVDAHSISGGTLEDCHVEPISPTSDAV